MAVKERSFWSTTSGVVTGLAGTLTAGVALITTAVQLGWVGGDSGDNTVKSTDPSAAVAPSTAPAAGGGGGGSRSGTGATGTPELDVSPTRVIFEPLDPRETVVEVRNTGTGPATLQPLKVEGPDKDKFTADQGCAGTQLESARSCDIKITFKPPAGPKTYNATLVIRGAAVSAEVPLQGKVLV